MHPYSSIDTTTVWKKLHFILTVKSDFPMTDSLLINVHVFASRMQYHCKIFQEYILYIQNEKAITLVYKNTNSLFINESYGKMAIWERERVGQELLGFYIMLRYIFIEPYNFMFLSGDIDIGLASQPIGCCPWLAPKMAWCIHSADCQLQLTAGFENFNHYIIF